VIRLKVNGKQVELERATPLLVYIEKLGVDPRAVAVEHNGTILERAAYQTVTLKEGDTVEIVRMVGGGQSAHPVGSLPPRLFRRARIAVLVQAVALLVVVGLAVPSYLDFLFRPLYCAQGQWCLDFRGLALGLTTASLGPPALLLFATYWLWRRPRKWPAAIPLVVGVIVIGSEVVNPHLIADAMSFATGGRSTEPPLIYAYAAVQLVLIFIPAVLTSTLVVQLLRQWGSRQAPPGAVSSTP
jgi:thiazole synthase/sulfur carrier protein